MRFSTANVKRYRESRVEEVDARQNVELLRELSSRIVPRSPRGGGGRGGGGSSGGKGSSSNGGSRGGSSNGGTNGNSSGSSRSGVSFGGGSRGSSSYSNGGGSRTTINSGVFAGRTVGGGTRDQVYGTSRYGSGYTYGGGSYVAGRGFPYGYWPVYIPVGYGYYGHNEYGPANNSSRPGGGMQAALVRANNWPAVNERRWLDSRQTNSNESASYYIVGDADTVSFVMQELVQKCSVVPTVGVLLNETNLKVHYEQAVQFYRSSSFMLALTSYNNSASLPSNAPANDNMAAPPTTVDTPLPAGTVMHWLECLNTTIGAAIPIMDSDTPNFSNSAAPAPPYSFNGLNFVGLLWVLLWLLKFF